MYRKMEDAAVRDEFHARWGGMVREATPMLVVYPHMALVPAFAITSLVMGFNLVADGLQDLADGG